MAPDTRERPPTGSGRAQEATGQEATTSLTDVATQARDLVAQATCMPPCDLVAWAEGFAAGYDAAMSGALNVRLVELAENIALHERERWVPIGAFSRRRRIQREVTEGAKRARPVRQSPDWPRVRVPGGGPHAA